VLPNNTTANDTTQNTTMIGELNALRSQCGPTTLPAVTPLTSLIISTTKHAGYQALYDAKHGTVSIDHGEPDSAIDLYSNDDFAQRIVNANNGADIAGANEYYEDIASQAGTPSIPGATARLATAMRPWTSPPTRHRPSSFPTGRTMAPPASRRCSIATRNRLIPSP
jgi:hypothetical protein